MAATTFEKKNVIVTGGAGFIGSHLCEALLQEGRVICIDNLSNGSTVNIEHLLSHPDFVFIRYDISEPLDLEALPELERFRIGIQGIQEIYQLACPMSVLHFTENKIATLLCNSAVMKVTLDWAVKYKARYIYTSSSTVYGTRVSDQAVNEQYIGAVNHLTERAAYDEGKRFAETMIATYMSMYGVDARIARLFRTYGPRLKMGDAQMITEFVAHALDNESLVIYGDESFRTTLLYVGDAVSAIMKLAKSSAGIGPVNIAGDQEFTFVQIAQKVMELVGAQLSVDHADPVLFLAEQPVPDTTHAKNVLGWMPLTRLDNGLQHMVDYVTANRHRLTY